MFFWMMAAGAAQGFFLAALLAGKARRGAASGLILSLLIGLISIRLAEVAVAVRLGHGFIPGLGQVTFPLIFTFPPLLYLYVEALGRTSYCFRPLAWLHFLPFAGYGAWIAMMLVPGRFHGMESRSESLLVDLPWLVQACAYAALILRRRSHAARRVQEGDASPERTNIRWIGFLTLTFLGIAFLVALHLTALLAGLRLGPEPRVVLYAAVALLLYLWGYRGLGQPELLFPTDLPALQTAGPEAESGRRDALQARILGFMEKEKPYLDDALSLHGLAERMNEPPYLVSQAINRGLGRTFFTFVNEYRVSQAKKRLAEPASGRLKLLALALDCGFASKSSFNRVFKDLAGMTPSEFQRRAAGGSQAGQDGQ